MQVGASARTHSPSIKGQEYSGVARQDLCDDSGRSPLSAAASFGQLSVAHLQVVGLGLGLSGRGLAWRGVRETWARQGRFWERGRLKG